MIHDPSGEGPTVRSGAEEQHLGELFSVTVIQGPDAGANLELNAASRALIGKGPVCTLTLTDPAVSRRHASLRLAAGSVVITDLGSTNGTFVNGAAIHEALLRGGETVRMGATVLTVARGTPSYVTLAQQDSFGHLLGASLAMRALYPVLDHVASRDVAVLIEGEPGTGKHLCAEEIHRHSARASAPFVTVSCESIPPAEMEERFFGEGGFAAEAAGGTIYVDEIAALSEALQKRLAGVVSTRARARTSAASALDDVRFLFGTRRDLDREVTASRFHDDLLAAIAPARVELPPLREREGDVALLAGSFWSSLAADAPFETSRELPADFVPRFQGYAWSGNVRELTRAVCTRFCLGEFGRWPWEGMKKAGEDAFADVLERDLPLADARALVVREFERRYVETMIARYGGTREAAKAAGVAQRYFQLLRARFRA